MVRILVAMGVVLLLTEHSLAQSNCDQIRQAIATYGYEAARQHALAHYGPEALAEGDKCLTAGRPTEARPAEKHLTKGHATKKHVTKEHPKQKQTQKQKK